MTSNTPGLTIGDLADRTGVTVPTLRAWERRHGFPLPLRLPSGHRRYPAEDVDRVQEVLRRRAEGVNLEVAIARVRDVGRPRDGSVFASMRRDHPHLPVERLHKSTLVALSWAIEDEFCAKADRARIFGAFQHARHYARSRRRWQELGRVASSAFVYADFDVPEAARDPDRRITPIQLRPDSPMLREWVVACDSDELPVALVAWELPGQTGVPDPDRIFEAIWTIEPGPVRTATRVCAGVAAAVEPDAAAPVLFALAGDPPSTQPDLAALNTMFSRVLRYVDRSGARA